MRSARRLATNVRSGGPQAVLRLVGSRAFTIWMMKQLAQGQWLSEALREWLIQGAPSAQHRWGWWVDDINQNSRDTMKILLWLVGRVSSCRSQNGVFSFERNYCKYWLIRKMIKFVFHQLRLVPWTRLQQCLKLDVTPPCLQQDLKPTDLARRNQWALLAVNLLAGLQSPTFNHLRPKMI